MKKNRLISVLAMLIIVAVVAGCSPAQAPPPAAPQAPADQTPEVTATPEAQPEADSIHIGVTLQDMANTFFVDLASGMEARARELGWEITIVDATADAATQIGQIETFIVMGVDAIVIAPIDQAALIPFVARAQEAGIRVITCTQDVEGSDALFGINEFDYGFMGGSIAGRKIVEIFGADSDVEVGIIDFPEIEALIDRADGLIAGIHHYAPNAQVVNQQSAASVERGDEVGSAFMIANPDMRVIAAINDSGALGAMNAVMAAGMATDDFIIVGLDATAEALSAIRAGGIFRGTVDIAPVQAGRDTMDLVNRVLQEGPVAEMGLFQMIPVDSSNIEDYF